MRLDLVSLTDEDLASLTNRGTVKRARKELDSGKLQWQFEEQEDGRLVVESSDQQRCEFPAGESLETAICSSGMSGITRYIVRAVMAYGQHVREASSGESSGAAVADRNVEDSSPADEPGFDQEPANDAAPDASSSTSRTVDESSQPKEAASASSPVILEPWDPGAIPDEALVAEFGKAVVTRARKRFQQGTVVELLRGAKPVARFLDEPCTLRFLVPGDVRYITADSTDVRRKIFVCMAVWAFRELAPDRSAGLLSLSTADWSVPECLASLEPLLQEMMEQGIANLSGSWQDRMGRASNALRASQLVWPAEIVDELRHQRDLYRQHDARFDAAELLANLGELLLRCDAIRSNTGAVPQLLVRGSSSDRPSDLGGGRFCGLGCDVVSHPQSASLNAFLQDLETGSTVVLERTFSNLDDAEQQRSFASLADQPVSRGVTLRRLASGQLLLKSGKRTASHRLVLPRTGLVVHPQQLRWESLRPPVFVESFGDIQALQRELPPLALRPRRRTETLHVVAVARVLSCEFDAARQELIAELEDSQEQRGRLRLPYLARAANGLETLVHWLADADSTLRFVSGHFRIAESVVEFRPIGCVFERSDPDGQPQRHLVQPFIEQAVQPAAQDAQSGDEKTIAALESEPMWDPLQAAHFQRGQLLADCLVVGVRRCGEAELSRWQELLELHERSGFLQLTESLRSVVEGLQRKQESRKWDSRSTVEHLLELTALHRLTGEV